MSRKKKLQPIRFCFFWRKIFLISLRKKFEFTVGITEIYSCTFLTKISWNQRFCVLRLRFRDSRHSIFRYFDFIKWKRARPTLGYRWFESWRSDLVCVDSLCFLCSVLGVESNWDSFNSIRKFTIRLIRKGKKSSKNSIVFNSKFVRLDSKIYDSIDSKRQKKFKKFDNFQFEIRSIRKKIIRKIRKFFKFSFINRKNLKKPFPNYLLSHNL